MTFCAKPTLRISLFISYSFNIMKDKRDKKMNEELTRIQELIREHKKDIEKFDVVNWSVRLDGKGRLQQG